MLSGYSVILGNVHQKGIKTKLTWVRSWYPLQELRAQNAVKMDGEDQLLFLEESEDLHQDTKFVGENINFYVICLWFPAFSPELPNGRDLR